MATKALPAGTRNTSLNCEVELLADLQKWLHMRGLSLSQWVRLQARREISAARLRGELANRGQLVMEWLSCVVFAVGLGVVGAAAVAGSAEPRAARPVRAARRFVVGPAFFDLEGSA